MRILVCGGRDYQDRERAFRELDDICERQITDQITIICGGANGADEIAKYYAWSRGLILNIFPAQWKKYGKAAGPIRNQQMLDEGNPDCVVAFPGGRGTADMVARALAAAIPVQAINAEPRE